MTDLSLLSLGVDQIIRIHDNECGLCSCNRPLLESAVGSAFQTFDGVFLNSTVYERASSLYTGISCNHPFFDGNKRTAFKASFLLLRTNNILIIATEKSAIELAYSVAKHEIGSEDVCRWMIEHGRLIDKY